MRKYTRSARSFSGIYRPLGVAALGVLFSLPLACKSSGDYADPNTMRDIGTYTQTLREQTAMMNLVRDKNEARVARERITTLEASVTGLEGRVNTAEAETTRLQREAEERRRQEEAARSRATAGPISSPPQPPADGDGFPWRVLGYVTAGLAILGLGAYGVNWLRGRQAECLDGEAVPTEAVV